MAQFETLKLEYERGAAVGASYQCQTLLFWRWCFRELKAWLAARGASTEGAVERCDLVAIAKALASDQQ